MAILRRLLVWWLEICCEAIFVGALIFLLASYGNPVYSPQDQATVSDLFRVATLALMMFFLTGYLLTTAIVRLVWRHPGLWFYPLASASLFLFHFQILSVSLGGAFDPSDRIKFRLCGLAFTFVCTFTGNYLLGKWEQAESDKARLKREVLLAKPTAAAPSSNPDPFPPSVSSAK